MTADSENPLVLNVLHASSTAYSFNPNNKIDEVSFFIFHLQFADVRNFYRYILTFFFLPISFPMLLVRTHCSLLLCRPETMQELFLLGL